MEDSKLVCPKCSLHLKELQSLLVECRDNYVLSVDWDPEREYLEHRINAALHNLPYEAYLKVRFNVTK